MSSPLDVLREKRDLFVIAGFRDDDGVWHDGPHQVEFDAALAQVEALVEAMDAYLHTGIPTHRKARENAEAALAPFKEAGDER